MAELLKISSEVEVFKKEYFNRNSQADENRQRENQAATRIQSCFRACKVRAYLSHLHKKAIIIQKIWRGFTARARFRQMVKAAYFIMKMNFYEEMAVRIQRRWRGFFVRKYIHNFYARKHYLEGLTRKNELVRMELDELEKLQKRKRDCLEMVKEQTAKVYQAHRLHHLLSTKQCPGVFNSPFRPVPHEMELLLRQVKYQLPTRLAPRDKAYPLGTAGPTAPSFPGTLGSPWIETARSCCSLRPILPPIASKKQQIPAHLVVEVRMLAMARVRSQTLLICTHCDATQLVQYWRRDEEDWPLVLAGLLREPGEVWEQRVHCPDLTLRLQTSYTHLEEAQNQLHQHEVIRLPAGTLGTGSMPHHLNHSNNSLNQPAYTKSVR